MLAVPECESLEPMHLVPALRGAVHYSGLAQSLSSLRGGISMAQRGIIPPT